MYGWYLRSKLVLAISSTVTFPSVGCRIVTTWSSLFDGSMIRMRARIDFWRRWFSFHSITWSYSCVNLCIGNCQHFRCSIVKQQKCEDTSLSWIKHYFSILKVSMINLSVTYEMLLERCAKECWFYTYIIHRKRCIHTIIMIIYTVWVRLYARSSSLPSDEYPSWKARGTSGFVCWRRALLAKPLVGFQHCLLAAQTKGDHGAGVDSGRNLRFLQEQDPESEF